MFARRRAVSPSLASFLVWATVARTLLWMVPVGLFFAAAASPATTSVTIGMGSAMTLGVGVALWPVGRVLDCVGAWRGLRASLLLGAAALGMLASSLAVEASTLVVLVGAGVVGVVLSPLVATPRALLASLVPPAQRPWASGIEATSLEVALIAAPLVAAVVARGGPVTVLLVAAAILTVVWLGFPHAHDATPSVRARSAPLLERRVIRLGGLAVLLGVSGGLLEPALADLRVHVAGWPLSPAVLFVAIGVGSAVGGLMAARSGWPHRSSHAAPLLALYAIGLLAAVPTDGALRLLAIVIAGLPIAPLMSLAGLHLDRWIDAARRAETFGVVSAVLHVATGVGQALAASLVAPVGPQGLVALAAAPAGSAAIMAALGTHNARGRHLH